MKLRDLTSYDVPAEMKAKLNAMTSVDEIIAFRNAQNDFRTDWYCAQAISCFEPVPTFKAPGVSMSETHGFEF